MTFEPKFLRCRTCGRLVMALPGGKDHADCCGEGTAELLTANTTDASQEKHVPVIEAKGGQVTVKIGSAPHPMVEAHYIQWIEVVDGDMVCRKYLKPGDAPEAVFPFKYRSGLILREYCNLHGLWTFTIP